jgi:hypothetical protein
LATTTTSSAVRPELRWLFAAAFVGFALLALLVPLEDNDLWWHLRSGDAIVAQHSLPGGDPFSFSGSPVTTERGSFILRSYWLSQVVLHAAYATAGLPGLIGLRALLLLAMFGAVYRRQRRLGVDRGVSLVVLAASMVLFTRFHAGERPQTYSFLAATLLIGLMEEARQGQRPSWLVLPLMAIWSNLHGGFVVGDVLLALFAVGSALHYRHDPRRARSALFWAAGGILASLANPCGWQAFVETAKVGADPSVFLFVDEYVSTWSLFRDGQWLVALLWFMGALTVAGLLMADRLDWTDLLLWALLSWFSVAYARNIAFFAVALAPLCGRAATEFMARADRHRLRKAAIVAAYTGTIILMASQIGTLLQRGSPLRREISNDFPAEAASFLAQAGGCQHVFNEYDWGGYLLWRLAPRSRFFIDGRLLEPALVRNYVKLLWGLDGEDGPTFRELLDLYRIDCVVQRNFLAFGNISPLVTKLSGEPGWTPVYVDQNAFVFMRQVPQNDAALRAFGMAPLVFASRLQEALTTVAHQHPGDYRPRLAEAELLMAMGRLGEANMSLEEAWRLSPGNEFVWQRLQQVRSWR